MESKARLTGYLCAAAILVLGLWMAGLILHEALHPARIVRVRFPELGTLMVQDPVMQDGVPIGKVHSLTLQDGYPLAEIELFREGFIASDSRFVNFNHSLMGARMVVLTSGHSTTPLDESGIQQGIFADGVAESLRRVQDLLQLVAEMRIQMDRLFLKPSGPLSPESFRQMEDNAQKLDQLALKIDGIGKSLQDGVETWMHLEGSLQTGLRSTTPGINHMEDQTSTLLGSALTAEQSAGALLTSAQKLLASVQDSAGALHPLLYDSSAYLGLKSSLKVLDNALRTYQTEGLSNVVGWRNLHFFRSKSPSSQTSP